MYILYTKPTVLYNILCNYMHLFYRQTPYAQGPDDSPEKILARIDQGTLDLTSGNWRSISPAAKDIVQRMLYLDPSARIQANRILMHPWITERAKLSELKLTVADTKIKVCKLAMFLCVLGNKIRCTQYGWAIV